MREGLSSKERSRGVAEEATGVQVAIGGAEDAEGEGDEGQEEDGEEGGAEAVSVHFSF